METRQGTILRTLRNAQQFIADHAAALGAIVTSGARQDLDASIADLDGHARTQSGQATVARGKTREHHALRAQLLQEHMAPISRIARIKLAKVPNVQALRMPRGKPTSETLVAAAKGMADAAAPYAAIFTNAGLAADFREQLVTAADAVLLPVTDRAQHTAKVKGATSGLRTRVVTARQVLHVLDALVRIAVKDDRALLDAWTGVSTVPRLAVPSAAAAAPAAAAAAAAPATSAAA